MSTTRDHVLKLPQFTLGIRIAQLAVGLAILGLAAYGITYLSFDGDNLSLFTALATMIIAGYVLVATLAVPVIYNYWAILGLDIFAIIFWIISFSLLGSEVATYDNYINTYRSYTTSSSDCDGYVYDGYCYYKKRSFLGKRNTTVYTYRNAMAAAAGLGGLEFVLFVITLVFTALALHRHRTDGGHCMPASTGITQEPKPMELQQNGGYAAPQPVLYSQQPQQTFVPQQQEQFVQQQTYPVQQQTYPQQQVVYAAQPDQQIASA